MKTAETFESYPSKQMVSNFVLPCVLVGGYGETYRLKMEAVRSSETPVSTYKSTRRYNPEEQHRHSHGGDDDDVVLGCSAV
jgi:hypothetical protein